MIDRIASQPQYSNVVATVDRNFPNDEWYDDPRIKINVSRVSRSKAVAKQILESAKAGLAQMTVTELMQNLKVRNGRDSSPGYVGSEVYPEWNRMVVDEIRSRPIAERTVLRRWTNVNSILETDPNGENLSVTIVVFNLLPDK